MSNSNWKRKLVIKGLIGALIMAATQAYADAPAAKWYDTIGLSGYLQGGYVGNLSAPQAAGGGPAANVGRVFDTQSNSFGLNAFHLQISKPVGDDGYGFTAKLHTGEDAGVIHSLGLGSGTTETDLEEAYLTVATPGLKSLTFTGGKFVTLEGVEVIESPMNPNYSEGLLFGYAEPFTHTGVKANYVFNDKVNGTVGVVNGWDQATDLNSGKTIIWQIATTPNSKVNGSFEGTYGPEASVNNNSERTSLDAVVNVTPIDKLSLWGQANWGQDTDIVPVGGTTAGDVHWSGLGAWAQYAFNSWYTEALRFEIFDDQNGADRLGGIGGAGGGDNAIPAVALTGSAVDQTMKEITWTHKFQLWKNAFTRLEYRHDWSNEGAFNGHVAGSNGKDQNTISMDYVVTF